MKKYWAGTFIPALFDQKIYTPKMSQTNGESAGTEIIKQKMCLSPDPEAHVRYAQQHIDLGFTHLFYHCAGPDQSAFLERYGRDVLTQLRQTAPKREPMAVS
jgi:coenzyme F420-dependent glucose-6-phosphate dehydrogenase